MQLTDIERAMPPGQHFRHCSSRLSRTRLSSPKQEAVYTQQPLASHKGGDFFGYGAARTRGIVLTILCALRVPFFYSAHVLPCILVRSNDLSFLIDFKHLCGKRLISLLFLKPRKKISAFSRARSSSLARKLAKITA
jgi:hypothetical protein